MFLLGTQFNFLFSNLSGLPFNRISKFSSRSFSLLASFFLPVILVSILSSFSLLASFFLSVILYQVILPLDEHIFVCRPVSYHFHITFSLITNRFLDPWNNILFLYSDADFSNSVFIKWKNIPPHTCFNSLTADGGGGLNHISISMRLALILLLFWIKVIKKYSINF